MMNAGGFIRASALLLAAFMLSGCIQASNEVAERIAEELGGSVWLLESGIYDSKSDTDTSEPMRLVRAIAPTGQRVYHDDEDNVYALYERANGRAIIEMYAPDKVHQYSYVEIYNSRTFGWYSLMCSDLTAAQRRLWFGDPETSECDVADLKQLLTVLDAARQNTGLLGGTFSLTETQPDEF